MIRNLYLATALALTACAQPAPPPQPAKWSKVGATYDDFLKARYKCLRDSRTTVSTIDFNAAGGGGASRQQISASIFLPCMAAEGYVRDPDGFAAPAGQEITPVK